MITNKTLLNNKTGASAFALTLALALVGCGGGSSSMPVVAGKTVTATFTGSPAAVADQIGMGSWTSESLQGNQLTLTLPPGETRYAVAYICAPANSVQIEAIQELTTQDPPLKGACALSQSTTPPTQGAATGSVDASAIPGTLSVMIFGRSGFGSVSGSAGSFDIQMLHGTQDIAFVALGQSARTLAVKILRSQNVPGAVNTGQTVMFAATDVVTAQTATVTNVPAGFNQLGPNVLYLTSKGTEFPLNPLSASQFPEISASEVESGDEYRFFANAVRVQPPPAVGSQSVSAGLMTSNAGAVSLALPTPLAFGAPTPMAFPTFAVAYTGFAVQQFAVTLGWGALPKSLSELTVVATAAYQNGASTITIPDLTMLQSFLSSPASGTTVGWIVSPVGSSQSNNATFSVTNSGSYTEP